MQKLLKKIDLARKDISLLVNQRLFEFENIGKDNDKIFQELCFCILTANSNAENCIRVQKETGHLFGTLDENELAEKFKQAGCRFHTKRANYIANSRKLKEELFFKIKELESRELRNWIEDNLKGLGMKESSHFLRNIGYKDLAIIDFHILDLLERENIIQRPAKLNKKAYEEIEIVLESLGKRAGLNLAELDLYLWYLETGKILK